jgi:CelD/BcsL family acetyltransferase involved in cellulose biosynthesis
MTLFVERLPGPESLAALAAEWEALHAQVTPRTPFTSPLWNSLWWKHLSEQRTWVRDEFFVHVVRDEHGALVAVAPLMLTHRPAKGPLRLRELHFFGADSNLTEIRGVVCRTDDHDAVIDALRAHFQAQQHAWHRLLWSGIREQHRARMLEDGDESVVWRGSTVGYYLPLPGSWDEIKSKLSRNMKEALRKCYNSLKREGHEFTLRVISEPQQVAVAIQSLFQLHRVRARADDMAQHPDGFERAAVRDFFLDYAVQMAKRDQLRIFQLEIGGEIVAARAAFVFGNEMYLTYSGYRPEWGRYSVMTTLIAEAFKWAIANQISGVHLSTGTDQSKTRWKPVEDVSWEGAQKSSSYMGRLMPLAYDNAVRVMLHTSSLMWLLPHIRRHHR